MDNISVKFLAYIRKDSLKMT